MNHYKIIFSICLFCLLMATCKKTEDSSNKKIETPLIQKEIIIEKNFEGIDMDSARLVDNIWEIINVKHSKEGKLQNIPYYKQQYNKRIIRFENTGVLKLGNDSIGRWNNRYVTIYIKDSLKGKYYFMKLNNLQLIRTKDDHKKEFFLINIQPKQEELKPLSQTKEDVINFDK